MIKDRLSRRAFALQIPVGSGESFTGHIDVLTLRQYIFDDATMGKKFQVVDCPPEFLEAAKKARHDAIEAAVEFDDDVMEKYLAGEELTIDEINRAIRKATMAMAFGFLTIRSSLERVRIHA